MKPFLLLSCRPEDAAAEGERRSVLHFSGLRDEELQQIRVELAPLPVLDLDDYSGVLLGGGPYNSSDPVKSQVQLRVEADLRRVLEDVFVDDVPFLGLCYGIGTVTAHMGGVVDRTYGEPAGPVHLRRTDAGHRDPLLVDVPETFQAFVGHKEAVRELPEGAVLLVEGDACPVQMFRVQKNCYVTQFHPELDAEHFIDRMKIYRHAGYFAPETLEDLSEQARDANVSPAVHTILSRFAQHYAR
ncbi:glutamine amidotransferase [Tessaracoccus antarcticus]|uniref:Glutamine amidotransferase n=1 Tax=Tessaracoccus antarcticus TaxID=2479848 RepID=A0A3M0GCP6_9ACTN|nr:glutamine amidotransferase [Tessaracoccus antarcticus]RMB58899.1 glutamine amidotransferase [Tessaracoccus antarcticus]